MPRKSSRTRKIHKKPKSLTCKQFLSKKIAENIREFNRGKVLSNGRRITSRKQAIAIAYSVIKRDNPYCRRFL